ncbi:MAG: hypothetical protein QOJ51_2754 [Acidobacteriaceae bacterium]|nr:hypothetical protein [Acidobacteriaceae bacterium]
MFCRPHQETVACHRPFQRQVAFNKARSKNLLHPQDQLIALGHVLRPKLVVSVDEVEPLVLVHDESRPKRTDLFFGIGQS